MEGKAYNRLTVQLKEVGLSTKQIDELLQLKEVELLVDSGKMTPEFYNKLINLVLASSEGDMKPKGKAFSGRVRNILKNSKLEPQNTSERAILQTNADSMDQNEDKKDKKSSRNLTQFIIGWRKRDVQRMTRKFKKEKTKSYVKNRAGDEKDVLKDATFSIEKCLSKSESNGSFERSRRSLTFEDNVSGRRIHPIRRMKGKDSKLWNQVTLDADMDFKSYSFSEKHENKGDRLHLHVNSLKNLESDPSWRTPLNEIIEYISIHGKTYQKGAKCMVFDDIYNSFYEIHDMLPEILLNGKEAGYLTYEGNLLVFGKDNDTKIEVNN